MVSLKSNGHLANIIKNKPSEAVKRYFTNAKTAAEKDVKSSIVLLISPWKLCTGVSLGLTARLLYNNGIVYCKALPSRIIQRRPNIHEDSAKFDWKRFWEYLLPHKWLLAAAVAVSSFIYLIYIMEDIITLDVGSLYNNNYWYKYIKTAYFHLL